MVFAKIVRCCLALALALGCATPALAAEHDNPALVIALYAKPAERVALRSALAAQVERLRRWKAAGLLAGYRLMFTRYSDAGIWDAMEQLEFTDAAALARWKAIERESPAGLDARTLALVQSIETTPATRVRSETNGPASADPVVLVIPYQALVPPADYLQYLDGYTVPQFRGWMQEGVLQSYDILTSLYPAGRPWNAMIMLRYRNDAALARRDAVVARVRARLANDPAWKAISDNKKAIRNERVLAIADQLAADDTP